MTITATTLASACASNDTIINVTSATGITGPNFTAGTGITILLIDQEFLVCIATPTGTFVPVLRGQGGTPSQAHVINSQVQIGLPADFPAVSGFSAKEVDVLNIVQGFNLPAIFLAGAADALTGAPGLFLVKTAGVNAMTIPTPTAAMEGNIVEVWSDTTNAHTITAATACVAAGQALKTVITFPAFKGAGVRLCARNLVWHIVGQGGVVAAGSCTLA